MSEEGVRLERADKSRPPTKGSGEKGERNSRGRPTKKHPYRGDFSRKGPGQPIGVTRDSSRGGDKRHAHQEGHFLPSGDLKRIASARDL